MHKPNALKSKKYTKLTLEEKGALHQIITNESTKQTGKN